jgi:hypothetical protein
MLPLHDSVTCPCYHCCRCPPTQHLWDVGLYAGERLTACCAAAAAAGVPAVAVAAAAAAAGAPHNIDETWAIYVGERPDCSLWGASHRRAREFGTMQDCNTRCAAAAASYDRGYSRLPAVNAAPATAESL